MKIQLQFDKPSDISKTRLDHIVVTFADTQVLFDNKGQEIEEGTQIEKRIPAQYTSELEAMIFEQVDKLVSTRETGYAATDILYNSGIAGFWQAVLQPIASHSVIVYLPLFNAQYPTNADKFCQTLLKIASFDAIPVEDINQALWPSDEEQDIGSFDRLGFDSALLLPNLASTLLMFSIELLVITLLFAASCLKKCCLCLRNKKGSFQGSLFFNTPISFVMSSYGVITLCCLLNLKKLSWDSPEQSLNSSATLLITVLIICYPLVIQGFLFKNRDSLAKRDFKLKYESAYENLQTTQHKYLLYPIFLLF